MAGTVVNYLKIQIFILALVLSSEMNGQVLFSVNSGFYKSPFNVRLTAQDRSALIKYTLDGSNPAISTTGFIINSNSSILIDPESTTGRPTSPGVIIRACLIKGGIITSKPVSRTYIFINKVRTQSWPGGNWPIGSVGGQGIDLDMDPEVVNDPDYVDRIDNALIDIPTISIITDLNNLFDPDTGIYVNAYGHGLEWERECSVELINPSGVPGFMVNAGLRIRGGSSRSPSFLKHGFRLFFREKYGNDKLEFPLFGNEGTDKFDKIDLRTDQDYAWSNGWDNSSFVREIFSRDSQGSMGQPYTRSRYYHLYLNGMYWGLYQTQERSEARFASSYLGGDLEDYDVLKINTEDGSYTIEATDGNLKSWERIWNMCQTGFESNSDYFRIEGKDEQGNPVAGGEILVDIDNLIDYMLVIFYTGNFDSPTSAFLMNKKGNNFYAIENRNDKSHGFTFYIHDAENAMLTEPIYPGVGINEDRVNIGTRNDDMKMEVNNFADFHPQWLHFKLSGNNEYRVRFADRAYYRLNAGGVFSPDSALKRLNKRIKEVDLAVIAESARWGDAKTDGSFRYTRNNNWLPEINKLRNDFIPFRTQIVIDQLKSAGLFPEFDAPRLRGPDGIIYKKVIYLSSAISVQLENPNNSGLIYYTLDGTDPRMPGGSVSQKSLSASGPMTLAVTASTVVKSRVFFDGKWSALKEVNFIKQQTDYNDLKVTELHYHPADRIVGSDTINGKDLEFIEFKNIGSNTISLAGLALDSAVHYQFPETSLLPPGQFYVVVSKPSKFYDYYGLIPSGNFQGNFSNSGEEVLLKDSRNNRVIDFTYDDKDPWPSQADGGGYSLTSKEKNPTGDPADYNYWTISWKQDGTPFADNKSSDTHYDDSISNGSLLIYPNPASVILNIQLDAEEDEIEIWLFNNLGKPVIHTFIGNPDILDLSAYRLPAGIYFLRVKTDKYCGQVPVIILKK